MLHNRQAPGRDFHKHFSLAPARSDTNPQATRNPPPTRAMHHVMTRFIQSSVSYKPELRVHQQNRVTSQSNLQAEVGLSLLSAIVTYHE